MYNASMHHELTKEDEAQRTRMAERLKNRKITTRCPESDFMPYCDEDLICDNEYNGTSR